MNAYVTDEYLALVKKRLRLTSTSLDDEISTNIQACREDLMRLGLRQEIVEDESIIAILDATRAYVLWRFSSDDTLAERSKRDYYDMRDELRKQKAYRIEDV
ncbi:MAG: hypothetical protein ACYCWE_20940 [Eubacteriales bacterium]